MPKRCMLPEVLALQSKTLDGSPVAGSRVTRGCQGRLAISRDVLGRPALVLSHSNRVLTLRRTLVMIKSTLRRSIRRAQVQNLIGRNVVELIDLPTGQPGRPSRAMAQAQASKVLKAAGGQASGFVKVVRASKGRYDAIHAATETSRTRTPPLPRCPPNSRT